MHGSRDPCIGWWHETTIRLASGYVLFFGLFSCYKGGDGSPDFLYYHLYNGYVAVTGGRPQDIAAAGMQSYFYPGLDALYYRLFEALNDHPLILEFLLGLPYALAAWLVWRIGCKVLPDDWPGREALAGAFALFGMTGAAGFATIGTTMSEVVPSLPMLAALAIWVEHRRNWRWLGAVGALAGLSVALKLTLLPSFVALLVVVALAEVRRPIAALRAALMFGGTGLVAALVVAGPWLLHNWQLTGNPIFPNFNDVFRSDLVDHGRWSDDRFKPHGFWRVLFYPAVWAFHPSNAAIELNTRDPRILMALVAAVALVVRRGANTAARLLALFVLVGLRAVGVSVLHPALSRGAGGVVRRVGAGRGRGVGAAPPRVARRYRSGGDRGDRRRDDALSVVGTCVARRSGDRGACAVDTAGCAGVAAGSLAVVVHGAVAAPECHGCRDQQQSGASGRVRNIATRNRADGS